MGIVELTRNVPFGESLIDHDGADTNELTVVHDSYVAPVTPEELALLIHASVQKVISNEELSYPPNAEAALKIATEFYEVYLSDTDLNRIEVVDRYLAELIDELERLHGDGFEYDEPVVVELFEKVHELEQKLVAA